MSVNGNFSSLPPVPSSLKETWAKVSADGKVDKKEFETLVKAAAPTGTDSELDNDEIKFLSAVKDKINSEQSSGEGTATKSIDLFNDNDVPDTLKEEWKTANSDGKITVKEYTDLLKKAAPNATNKELTEDEVKFLSKLKEEINSTKDGILDTNTVDSSKFKNIPDTLKKEWNNVSKDGKINKEEYNKLLDKAIPNKHDEELDNDELKFFKELKGEFDKNEKGISKSKAVPKSLEKEWKEANKDEKITPQEYNNLVNKAAPSNTNKEFSPAEVNFLSDLKKKLEKEATN